MNKKILIISYTFPPTPGIGGRRWAKFAKYLHREGCDIEVLAAKVSHNKKESLWKNDVKSLQNENRVTFVNTGYPRFLQSPKNIFEKLMYKISLLSVKYRTKGNYYDSTVFWDKYLIPEIEKYIDKGYGTIIATGAPFSYLAKLVQLKKKYKHLKLIADIRDPWTNNRTGYGYDSLSKKRLMYEKSLEKEVVNNYDAVITVYDETTEYFSKLEHHNGCKFLTIRNGFDYEDMQLPLGCKKEKSDKLTFVYVGNFYPKALHNLQELLGALDMLKLKHIKVYDKLQLDFYGDVPKEFHTMVKIHSSIIRYHGRIPLENVPVTIFKSDATMLFLTDDMTYSFSTKFYEYVSLKRPILLFSKKGSAGQFIEENKLGFMIPYGDMYRNILHAINEIENNFQVNEAFELSQYDVKNLTKEIIKVI